jgi:hypothetical protein
MPRPVRALMRKRDVIAFGIVEHLERRHLDVITADRVVGAIPTVADVGAGCSEKRFGACIARQHVECWFGLGQWRLRPPTIRQALHGSVGTLIRGASRSRPAL